MKLDWIVIYTPLLRCYLILINLHNILLNNYKKSAKLTEKKLLSFKNRFLRKNLQSSFRKGSYITEKDRCYTFLTLKDRAPFRTLLAQGGGLQYQTRKKYFDRNIFLVVILLKVRLSYGQKNHTQPIQKPHSS